MNLRMIKRLSTMTMTKTKIDVNEGKKEKTREYQDCVHDIFCTTEFLSCREREQFQWVVADKTEGKLKYGRK